MISLSSRWLQYESIHKEDAGDYGEITNINNDGTVDVDIGLKDSSDDSMPLRRVKVPTGYTPKLGDWVGINWKNNNPVISDGSNTYSKDINKNSTKISSSPEIGSGIVQNDHIEARTIKADRIATETLTAEEIASDTITADKIATETITTDEIASGTITANKIATGTITADEIASDTITADEIATDTITAEEITSDTITADEIKTETITTDEIASDTITADKIATGTITAESGVIESIDADVITTGTLDANEVSISSDNVIIDSSGIDISDGTIDLGDGEFIVDSSGELDATKGSIGGWSLGSTTLDGGNITLDSSGKVIIEDDDNNQNVVLGEYDTDTYGLNILNGSVLIEDVDSKTMLDSNGIHADSIYTGNIEAKRMQSNIIDAVNLYAEEMDTDSATIDTAVIGDADIENAQIKNLDASKIDSGDIEADRMEANAISAVNLYSGDATIEQAKIEDLDAEKITSGTLDTSLVSVSSDSSGTGARVEMIDDSIVMYDTEDNAMIRLNSSDGFIVHVEEGMKLDTGGSIKLGGDSDILIDDSGIKAKAGGSDYTAFFTGDSLRFEDPDDTSRQLIMNSGEVQLTTNGGDTASTAITPDGIYGDILMDYSIDSEKFDTTPPDIPTWRDDGVTSIIEETTDTKVVTIVIKWNEVSDDDLDGYRIYLLEENEEFFTPVTNVGKTDNYKIRGVKSNTHYEVKVSSFDVQGNECDTSTPDDTSLTTHKKTITTVKDDISPAQPQDEPTVKKGLKVFAISWDETTVNEDDSECIDIDHYEVEKYSSDTEEWKFLGNVKGTSIIDEDVEYDYSYRYRYRPVDTSGNKPDWSPEAVVGSPSKVGSYDIVADSISAEHIKAGELSGDMIEAHTIEADRFESALYGDITQALRYTESKLKYSVYQWFNSDENYSEGTFEDTHSYKGVLQLDTVAKWDEAEYSEDVYSETDFSSGTLENVEVS